MVTGLLMLNAFLYGHIIGNFITSYFFGGVNPIRALLG
ncbi:MAG: hypothetical protein Nk1A_7350 [Endomicrobiia bacterium]|nr:MAG: hypothetical protein Nk1A_7350 [Endomicrobiia bacterium]